MQQSPFKELTVSNFPPLHRIFITVVTELSYPYESSLHAHTLFHYSSLFNIIICMLGFPSGLCIRFVTIITHTFCISSCMLLYPSHVTHTDSINIILSGEDQSSNTEVLLNTVLQNNTEQENPIACGELLYNICQVSEYTFQEAVKIAPASCSTYSFN